MSSEFSPTGTPEPQGFNEEPLFYASRLYLVFLQGLFKQFAEGSYKWSDDDRLTEIWISDQSPFPHERISQRPAIITMRGPARFANLSLDQMQELDRMTGRKRRTDIIGCTMSLNCIAKSGVEAQRLAWIVFTHIRRFKALLQRHGFHKIGDDMNMGPESDPGSIIQPESDSEIVMVTVQSPFYLQWTEDVTPADAALLDAINTHIHTRVAPPYTTRLKAKDATLRRPTIRGRPISPDTVFPIPDPAIDQDFNV